MSELIVWAHNPGQRYVKDRFAVGNGAPKDSDPYPAVVAPWAQTDDTGLKRRGKDLTATVAGALYIGGVAAERLPLANRQQDAGRLESESPIYQCFAQMSAQHLGLAQFANGEPPRLLIATALPVAWRNANEDAEAALRKHIKQALGSVYTIQEIYVQSEPNAVVGAELLDDNGELRKDQGVLAKGLVCVGDIGGGTLNRSVLEALRALPGESQSPAIGSSQAVRMLADRAGIQYIDAERRLEQAVKTAGRDPDADGILKQYRERIVTEFQEAWKTYKTAEYLFAGGTLHWVAAELRRVWPRARFAANPQQQIAIGLWRYARRRALRGK